MTERKDITVMPAQQTETVRYLIGRYMRPITLYLCCVHCAPCHMVNRHDTPCQHVDDFGHKDCVAGQIPVD